MNKNKKHKHLINKEIKAAEVRLIGEYKGKVVSRNEALAMAEEAGLDLVEVSSTKESICLIVDYNKYLFELKRKEKEKKANQHVAETKEIRLGATIGEHDLNFKLNHAQKFLSEKNLVKFTILFKGRVATQYTKLGEEVFNRVLEALKDKAVIEVPMKLEGKKLSMTVKSV